MSGSGVSQTLPTFLSVIPCVRQMDNKYDTVECDPGMFLNSNVISEAMTTENMHVLGPIILIY